MFMYKFLYICFGYNYVKEVMIRIRKISALLLIILPFFIWSQDNNVLLIHSYHMEKVKMQFIQYPLLSSKLKTNSSNILILVFTKNCKEGMITADSIQFIFNPIESSSNDKTSITIIPDTLTTFSSYIFAYMLYEHAEIFEKPKNSNKPIFTTIETDKYDSLLFLDQQIDKKGQTWYYVQFKSDREDNQLNDSEDKIVQGWVLRGRTRLNFWGLDCY